MLALGEKESTEQKNPIIIKFIYNKYRKDKQKSNIEPVEMDSYWQNCYDSMFKKW